MCVCVRVNQPMSQSMCCSIHAAAGRAQALSMRGGLKKTGVSLTPPGSTYVFARVCVCLFASSSFVSVCVFAVDAIICIHVPRRGTATPSPSPQPAPPVKAASVPGTLVASSLSILLWVISILVIS